MLPTVLQGAVHSKPHPPAGATPTSWGLTHCGPPEGPARSCRSLVLDWGDHALVSPVKTGGECSVRPRVTAGWVRGGRGRMGVLHEAEEEVDYQHGRLT